MPVVRCRTVSPMHVQACVYEQNHLTFPAVRHQISSSESQLDCLCMQSIGEALEQQQKRRSGRRGPPHFRLRATQYSRYIFAVPSIPVSAPAFLDALGDPHLSNKPSTLKPRPTPQQQTWRSQSGRSRRRHRRLPLPPSCPWLRLLRATEADPVRAGLLPARMAPPGATGPRGSQHLTEPAIPKDAIPTVAADSMRCPCHPVCFGPRARIPRSINIPQRLPHVL